MNNAPGLRRGATNHRWAIVVPERGRRPSDFEQRGTGFYINPMPPESAARYLREADILRT